MKRRKVILHALFKICAIFLDPFVLHFTFHAIHLKIHCGTLQLYGKGLTQAQTYKCAEMMLVQCCPFKAGLVFSVCKPDTMHVCAGAGLTLTLVFVVFELYLVPCSCHAGVYKYRCVRRRLVKKHISHREHDETYLYLCTIFLKVFVFFFLVETLVNIMVDVSICSGPSHVKRKRGLKYVVSNYERIIY